MSEFVKVAELKDLPPGRQRVVHYNGKNIALYHVENQIFATADACPHEAVSLGKGGYIEGYTVSCGYHHWSFDLRTGDSADGMDEHLETYPVRILGDDICVLLPAVRRQGRYLDV